jgi:hypothetical protein
MHVQPFIFAVACLQVVGGLYSFWQADWKMGVINVAVGIANGILSSMAR